MQRRRWWIRLAAAVALVPWFAHFAYTRMTVMPPEEGSTNYWDNEVWQAGINYPHPNVDKSADLAAAFARLQNALPTGQINLPAPPAGMVWVPWHVHEDPAEYLNNPANVATSVKYFDLYEAADGPWLPERRYHQMEAMKLLQTPTVATAMQEIADLAGQPFYIALDQRPGTLFIADFRTLIITFMVQVRCNYETQADLEPAIAHIETVLKLVEGIEDDGPLTSLMVGGIACRRFAYNELMIWSKERPLTPQQGRRILQLLDDHPFEFHALMADCYHSETKIMERLVDQGFTKRANGNGWAVLYRSRDESIGDWLLRTQNWYSPAFNSRRDMMNKIDHWLAFHLQMLDVDYPDLIVDQDENLRAPLRTDRISVMPPTFNPTDLYFDDFKFIPLFRAFQLTMRTLAQQNATRVAVALSMYRHDHNRYPESLDALIPAYLDQQPTDPFSGRPFCYKLESPDEYLLYSADIDAVDDGGNHDYAISHPDSDGQDFVYDMDRDDPGEDYVLVPFDNKGGNP